MLVERLGLGLVTFLLAIAIMINITSAESSPKPGAIFVNNCLHAEISISTCQMRKLSDFGNRVDFVRIRLEEIFIKNGNSITEFVKRFNAPKDFSEHSCQQRTDFTDAVFCQMKYHHKDIPLAFVVHSVTVFYGENMKIRSFSVKLQNYYFRLP